MTRPHSGELATAHYDISVLFSRDYPRNDPNQSSGFRDAAKVAELLLWAALGVDQAREGAAYPRGVDGGVRTLHRGSGHSDIDARTHDDELRKLRGLRGKWQHELGQMVDRWDREREEIVGRQGVRTVAQ